MFRKWMSYYVRKNWNINRRLCIGSKLNIIQININFEFIILYIYNVLIVNFNTSTRSVLNIGMMSAKVFVVGNI